DRAAEGQIAEYPDWVAEAGRVRVRPVAVGEAEGQLELVRHPAVAGAGRTPEPLAEVAADRLDAVLPHPRDGGREILGIARRHPLEHHVERRERPLEVGGPV